MNSVLETRAAAAGVKNSNVAAWHLRVLASAVDLALWLLILLVSEWLFASSSMADALSPIAGKALAWMVASLLVVGCWKIAGATPGKMVFASRVVDAGTGGPLGLGQCLVRWVGLLASAVPLGAGLHWAALDPKGQAVHDKLAGTLVVVVPRVGGAAPAPKNLLDYLRCHWRGELGVAPSLFVNTLLLPAPMLAALVWLSLRVNVDGEDLRLWSTLLVVLWPLALATLGWGAIGTWRALHAHVGVDPRVGLAVQVLVGALVAVALGSTLFDFAPRLGSYLALIRGSDPMGHAGLSASPDGRRLRMSGAIGMGDSRAFLALAAQAPQARTLEIESLDGRLGEARRIAELVHSQGWLTRAVGACDGPCALIFVAGAHRQLMPGASLGLKRIAPGMLSWLTRPTADQSLAQAFGAVGAPTSLLRRILTMPPSGRYSAGPDQWARDEVVDPPSAGLEIHLPEDRAHRTAAELAELLRGNPAWYALELHYPGAVDAASARMVAASADPAADDATVLAEGQGVFADLLPRLLQETDAEQRVRYLPIWRDQLAAARMGSPAQCLYLLTGQAAGRRGLPAEISEREASWIVEATQVVDAQAVRPVTAVETEVIRHQLGERAPEVIDGLMVKARGRNARPDCEHTIQILDLVGTLPLRTRQLAARAVFQD
ncbi:MAG: RDD family protein [Burkholderiaceae bacterium]|nr:RDD family protein [Burkholderiaceae bacterium]